MKTIDEKAREELERLDSEARVYKAQAEIAVNHDRESPEGVIHALLAIEARLAMATSFVLWALESDDEPQRKPRI